MFTLYEAAQMPDLYQFFNLVLQGLAFLSQMTGVLVILTFLATVGIVGT